MDAFEPSAMLDLIEAERVTVTQVVPTMLAAMCDEQLERPRDVSSRACSRSAARRALPRRCAARAARSPMRSS